MEKLTRKDIEILLEILQKEKQAIHDAAISDAGAREREIDLDFIIIKLNTIIKQIEG